MTCVRSSVCDVMPTVGKSLGLVRSQGQSSGKLQKNPESNKQEKRETDGENSHNSPNWIIMLLQQSRLGRKKIGITIRTNIKTIFQGAPCGDGRLLVELNPGSHGGNEHDYMIISYIFYYYIIL